MAVKRTKFQGYFLHGLTGLVLGCCWSMSALAQTVTPTTGSGDVGTYINTNSLGAHTVTGGTPQLKTLFHSFEDFSPETTDVLFQLDASQSTIEYVIGRVTGNNPSFIDGEISLAGGNRPDLFLINPNGITFGANASLQLPGSFLASTVDRILFEENRNFSSSSLDAVPMLTVSAPVGLQMGNLAKAINVDQSTLIVNPGEGLGLLGGDLHIAGGYLNAEGGQLSLGSVATNSEIGLDSDTFQANYSKVTDFQDIALVQSTIADVSGEGGGSFQIQGQTFLLSEGSILEASNTGDTDGSTSSIQTAERVEVIGTGILFDGGFIVLDTLGTGQGNHLLIKTDELLMSQAALVETSSSSDGVGGNLTVNAKDIFISGDTGLDAEHTVLATTTYGPGQAGNLTITADQFVIENDVLVFADTFGSGNGGNNHITVGQLSLLNGGQAGTSVWDAGNGGTFIMTATESIEVVGTQTLSFGLFSSGLFASAEPGSTGNAGEMIVTTPVLRIVEGGKVAANTLGEGNGGNIVIRAETIDVADPVVDEVDQAISGLVANVVNASSGDGGSIDIETTYLNVFDGGQVTVSTEGNGDAGTIEIRAAEVNIWGESDQGIRSAITSSSTTRFDAGTINIDSDRVTVQEGAVITVSSLAGGQTGNLNINSDRLYLNNGVLQALTTAGNQGNIFLDTKNVLLMRQGSQINTNATGTATGGNITLRSPVIVGIENSDITANAVFGSGGNIDITAQSLVGLEFRSALTAESDITASSQFGVNGTVAINHVLGHPSAALEKLPESATDPVNQIVAACAANHDNQFTASGRVGLPPSPTYQLVNLEPWIDMRALRAMMSDESHHVEPLSTETLFPKLNTSPMSPQLSNTVQVSNTDEAIVEASEWHRGDDGQVIFLANTSENRVKTSPISCLTQRNA